MANPNTPYPSNSNKAKSEAKAAPEKKDINKVVTGSVIQKKRSLGDKIKGIFVGGEFKSAAMYIASDVLLPAVRNMVVDATTKGIERVIYGDDPRAPRRRNEPGRPRIAYNNPIDRRPRSTMLPDQPPREYQRRHDPGHIIMNSREDAEAVAESLQDICEKYDAASVADLKELVGLPTAYTDHKWGWSVLHYVDVRQVRDGWLLDMPSVEPL
jgi:hypothetical protein